KPAGETEFFPILANFGTDTQEFHVGMGAVAVPGVVAGMFKVHRDLGHMPMSDVLQPAIELARHGVRIDALHHYIVRILESILRADQAVFSLFQSPSCPDELIRDGEMLRNPALADTFQALVDGGEELFYRGELAQRLAREAAEKGGHLTLQDLETYRVELREPLEFHYRGARCLINPPPSPGGCLIAFAMGLLAESLPGDAVWGEPGHVRALVKAFRAATRARAELGATCEASTLEALLTENVLAHWSSEIQWHSLFSRGTTHISIADSKGNMASLTASNGEGNTHLLPGTGIILNNMLGEEDLNPAGFHHWRENSRLASMMSPLIAECADGSLLALGTGGSNRIRSAIVQVLVNILDFNLPLRAAVAAPRLHLEGRKLSIEAGYSMEVLQDLQPALTQLHTWPDINLFFGGVHSVRVSSEGVFEGGGDPRRDGAVAIA
ncbi:MAG TPA: gamma-glutamyltransferase, partial [Xanthomonadales bacterium]|nr:gamma-glutamyltransferase [Xanthomonadales bacterium]